MTNPNSQIESFPSEGRQFFTPVSVGILVQLFCAGLVMAVTAAISLSSSTRSLPIAVAATSNAAAGTGADGSNKTNGSNETEMTAGGADAPVADGDGWNAAATAPAATAPAATAPAATTPAVSSVRALDDVRQKSRKLPLAGEGLSDEIDLCKIFAQDPATVTLQLIGGEFTVPEQMTLTLKPFPVDAKSFLWKVSQESTSGLARNQEIGEFILKEQQLSFRWFRNMDKGKLPFCRLKISVGPDSEICDLWSVARSGAAKVRFAKSEQLMDEFVPSGIRLPPFEILELDLTLENWPEHKVSGEKLTFNETITVTFPDDESNNDLITLKLSLDRKEGRYALRGEYLFNAPVVSTRRKKTEVHYEEEKLTEDQLKKTSDSLKSSASKVEKDLDSVQQILTALNDRRAGLVQQISNGAGNAQRAALQQVDAQITDKEDEETELQTAQEELNVAAITVEKVKSLCEDIGNQGRIQYRLYRPFAGDGRDIVIAATVTEPASVNRPAAVPEPAAVTEPAAVEENR
jgi:hypothetical protein